MASWILFGFITMIFIYGINLEKFVPPKTEYEKRLGYTLKPVLFVFYIFTSIGVFYNKEMANQIVVGIINFFG
ncbi:hypothetical protein LZX05_08140 [Campylobacter coli]|uniref:hypothetical protein n=1 Tax=Campylobacter coli TaxID=195 RepID=UPI00117EAF7F|nr:MULTISPECIES: hypothetical protein [Campylobacter]EAH6045286.1 hypothetical protein [Campylobacter coli]EGK8198947.1 hypothetical protein [Campylobacter coli]ELX1390938.1 hypothetical protein [Campylobacter coli]ELX1405384.1 hypothetical protein [Campylobacter coli]MCE7300031.1 hypothetical protein [Campylobacter coli]